MGDILKDDEYECSCCRGVFKKGWTDEEQQKEKDELFPDVALENCSIVCDDCFEKVMDFNNDDRYKKRQ